MDQYSLEKGVVSSLRTINIFLICFDMSLICRSSDFRIKDKQNSHSVFIDLYIVERVSFALR